MKPWTEDIQPYYNACTDPCDMMEGPCCCGAWHQIGEFKVTNGQAWRDCDIEDNNE